MPSDPANLVLALVAWLRQPTPDPTARRARQRVAEHLDQHLLDPDGHALAALVVTEDGVIFAPGALHRLDTEGEGAWSRASARILLGLVLDAQIREDIEMAVFVLTEDAA